MDRVPIRILVGVAAKNGENPFRRRGKGSSTMIVSRGLVDPKSTLNRSARKGSRLIFLHHQTFARARTHPDRLCRVASLSKRIIPRRTAMVRMGRKRDGVDNSPL